MKLTRSTSRRFGLVGVAAAASLVLASCAGDSGGGSGGGGGGETDVPIGSDAATYAAALEDMTPTTLVFQIGGSPEASTSQPYKDFAEEVAEYSGGKIEMELAWSNGVIPNTAEIDRGLLDGRLDIGVIYAAYNAEDYPINNLVINATVLRDPSVLSGTLSSAAAYEEVILQTPDAMAEYLDQGITPMYTFQPETPMVMHCSEPVTSLADLAGKQVRAATPAMGRQLDALGAVAVSLAYNEVYEALQRGILDCAMGIHGLGTTTGWSEVAPYIIHTAPGAAFVSTPTPYFAGIGFSQMPPVAQQLVQELFVRKMARIKEIQVADIVDTVLPNAIAHGGGFLTFDDEVSEKLKAINEELVEEIRTSSLFDGEDYITRLEAAQEKWKGVVDGLGYEDLGPADELADWWSDDILDGSFVDALVEGVTPITVTVRP